MRTKTFALAASLVLSLSHAVFAQTPAGGASATGNMTNPGSVKSNSEKGMGRSTGFTVGNNLDSVDGIGGHADGAGNTSGGTGSRGGVGKGNAGAQAPR